MFNRNLLPSKNTMANMNQKRNRSANWDEEEKEIFKMVIKDYRHIIDSKCLRNETNKAKLKAWEELRNKFNQLNIRPRDVKHLRSLWKRMKRIKNHETTGSSKGPTKTKVHCTPCDEVEIDLLEDFDIEESDRLDVKEEFNVLPETRRETESIASTSTMPEDSTNSDFVITEISRENVGKECQDPLTYSKLLSKREHTTRMRMAAEEHSLNMEIAREKLKCAIIERQMMELKFQKLKESF